MIFSLPKLKCDRLSVPMLSLNGIGLKKGALPPLEALVLEGSLPKAPHNHPSEVSPTRTQNKQGSLLSMPPHPSIPFPVLQNFCSFLALKDTPLFLPHYPMLQSTLGNFCKLRQDWEPAIINIFFVGEGDLL